MHCRLFHYYVFQSNVGQIKRGSGQVSPFTCVSRHGPDFYPQSWRRFSIISSICAMHQFHWQSMMVPPPCLTVDTKSCIWPMAAFSFSSLHSDTLKGRVCSLIRLLRGFCLIFYVPAADTFLSCLSLFFLVGFATIFAVSIPPHLNCAAPKEGDE